MKLSGIDSLSEGQKQCLRLVFQHYQSKEIARELGISVATVNQRIDAARTKLGSVSRVQAARLLAAAEGAGLPDPILYDPIEVPVQADPEQHGVQIEGGPAGREFRPWPTAARSINDLTWAQRSIAIVAIALAGLLAMAILVSIMNGIGLLVGG